MDFIGAALVVALAAPEKVVRPDGTHIAEIKPRTFKKELQGNMDAFKDWRLWVMVSQYAECCGEQADASSDPGVSARPGISCIRRLSQCLQKQSKSSEPAVLLLGRDSDLCSFWLTAPSRSPAA